MSGEEKMRTSGEGPREAADGSSSSVLPTTNPDAIRSQPPKPAIPAAAYVIVWITLSSSVILFNKWILDTLNFRYPVILTTYHLLFATVMTQILARYTSLLDGRKSIKMTGRVYLRAIVPIGVFFSLSLICGNLTYLYLSVAFIQMLKASLQRFSPYSPAYYGTHLDLMMDTATTPVAVLLASWAMGVAQPNLKVFLNVMVIVVGVILASIGEIRFVLVGFLYQMGGIVFEALRLTMVQRLLSSADFKMDPLVSLYYFAPVCATMNLIVALLWEVPKVSMAEVQNVGFLLFFVNGLCAFLLNVSVVFLIGKTSVLVLTLCGVLKDILLVGLSMAIWGTPVTGLQFFGYGIALCGMVYFKLGYDTLKSYAAEGGRKWAEFGATRPALRKLVVAAAVLSTIAFILSCAGPSSLPTTLPTLSSRQ